MVYGETTIEKVNKKGVKKTKTVVNKSFDGITGGKFEKHDMLKAIVDADSRRYLGFHHVGDGAKVSFQYLSHFLKTGWTVDQMAEQNEIFLNAEHFIQLSRLVAGQEVLKGFAAQVPTMDDL